MIKHLVHIFGLIALIVFHYGPDDLKMVGGVHWAFYLIWSLVEMVDHLIWLGYTSIDKETANILFKEMSNDAVKYPASLFMIFLTVGNGDFIQGVIVLVILLTRSLYLYKVICAKDAI